MRTSRARVQERERERKKDDDGKKTGSVNDKEVACLLLLLVDPPTQFSVTFLWALGFLIAQGGDQGQQLCVTRRPERLTRVRRKQLQLAVLAERKKKNS